jgi:hypothetical protein
MVIEGYTNWGYFGLAIKGRWVFCTVGAFAGVIAGPAVGAALIVALLVYNCMKQPVAGAKGAVAAPTRGAQHAPEGGGVFSHGNPLGGFPLNVGVDAREEARKHWKNGAGELPPGWDWTDGERGRVCYVDYCGAPTYVDPRKNFETYAHEFELAKDRGVDLLNMCVRPPPHPSHTQASSSRSPAFHPPPLPHTHTHTHTHTHSLTHSPTHRRDAWAPAHHHHSAQEMPKTSARGGGF